MPMLRPGMRGNTCPNNSSNPHKPMLTHSACRAAAFSPAARKELKVKIPPANGLNSTEKTSITRGE